MTQFWTTLVFVTVTTAAVSTTTARDAFADRRMFTSTYEYKTTPEGHTALELWHTESRDTWDSTTPQRMNEVLELEHGLTDHWDAALYTIFDQVAGGTVDGVMTASDALRLSHMNIETRYRFADRGELPVDIVAYGEFSKAFGESVYEFEGKGIVARDFDKLTVALNVIAAIQVGKDAKETEPELGWAAGGTYELHPKVNLGVETFGSIENEKLAASVGPALAIAPSSGFWFTFTAGFGVTNEAPALSGRLILGVEI